MIPEERRRRILALMSQSDEITVNALAAELRVSRETVRRDLRALEERRLLRKVHGGAVHLQTASENDVAQRATQQLLEKQRIAERAARLFKSGDSLFIDAGTTTAVFAGELAKASGLTVITNSHEVAARLWRGPGRNRVQLLGGEYRGDVAETVGPLTVAQVAGFQPDHAVLTVGAVDLDGFLDFNIEEAAVAMAMLRHARAATVLADHTKLARPALVRVCGLGAVSRLVTDRAPPDPLQAALRAAGVEIVLA